MSRYLECKQCGGQVPCEDGKGVAVCPYCGSQNTVGKSAISQGGLVNRANYLRRNNEFDKAAAVYEELLKLDNTDYEAHWGLVLCKFGIEYVEDPGSGERVPTCHRTYPDSIFADAGYKSALEYAPLDVREVYEKEAAQIDRIQKNIIALSKREEKYDVFLCYKEQDASGKRTEDSVIAQELEFELTRRGYRVFFARKTLDRVLGSEYEPIIYAALQSARAMVVLGTKAEHFSAVWVRNEWSRYRELIKRGADKVLIPAYRGMSPGDLPMELSALQALDMGKLGFVQDLCDGIDRFTRASKHAPEAASAGAPAATGTPGAEALVKRAFLFLEEGKNEKAAEYFERVLDQNPEEPRAYMGRLLLELQCRTEKDLLLLSEPLTSRYNYKKAVQFAQGELRERYEALNRTIAERIEQAKRIEAEKEERRRAEKEAELERRRAEEAALVAKRQAEKAEEERQRKLKKEKKKRFNRVFWPVFLGSIVAIVFAVAAINRMNQYDKALSLMSQGEYREAQYIFAGLNDYRDSDTKLTEAFELANKADYERAGTLMAAGQHEEAAKLYRQLGTYGDAPTRLIEAGYQAALDRYAADDCAEAAHRLAAMDHYKESDAYLHACAVALFAAEDYGAAVRAWQAGGSRLADARQDAELIECVDWFEHSIAGYGHLIGVNVDGSCVSTGLNDRGQRDVSEWRGVVEVAASSSCTIGLAYDGTTGAVGEKAFGQCDVSKWKDIVQVAAGNWHTVGLKKKGAVVAVGSNDKGQCDVSDWRNIVEIAAAWSNTVGLRSDGTVIVAGDNENGQCDVSEWTGIVAVASGGAYTVGLKDDGTVVVAGSFDQKSVSGWQDIVAISALTPGMLGLKADGTVVYAGNNYYGQDQIGDWRNIIAIAACNGFVAGVDEDGLVHVVGDSSNEVSAGSWDLW